MKTVLALVLAAGALGARAPQPVTEPVTEPAPEPAPELVEVRPVQVDAARLAREFDTAWRLPPRPADQPGLLPALEALAEARFEATVDGVVLRTLGDLFVAADELGPDQRVQWLERVLRAAPALGERRGALEQLLLDRNLRRDDWDAERDADRDGFLMGAPWRPGGRGEAALPGPWGKLEVRPEIQQGATLVRADLATFKQVENDFRLYHGHRGATYEWIHPEPDHYVRGEQPGGGTADSSLVVFRSDLPFPFGSYDCRLHVQNRLDARGRLVCDIYSTSGDFHFMAGSDVFLPVRTGDGAGVGFLVVRDFGFDLDGVPDSGEHCRAALRRSLGNLKLEAERRAAGRKLGALEGELPAFVMYGRRD